MLKQNIVLDLIEDNILKCFDIRLDLWKEADRESIFFCRHIFHQLILMPEWIRFLQSFDGFDDGGSSCGVFDGFFLAGMVLTVLVVAMHGEALTFSLLSFWSWHSTLVEIIQFILQIF